MKYHLTLVRMAVVEENTNNKRWRGCGKKENPCTLLIRMDICATIVKNSLEVSQKMKKKNYHLVQQPHPWAHIRRKYRRCDRAVCAHCWQQHCYDRQAVEVPMSR